MDAEASSGIAAFRPPKIDAADRTPSALSLLRVMVRNPVAAVPRAAYEQPSATLQAAGRTLLFPTNPGIVDEVLVRRHADFVKTVIDRRLFDPIFSGGLLTAEGAAWRWQRRLAAPAFRHATLSQYVPAMRSPFEEVAARWERDPGSHRIDDAMTAATLAVICRAFFTDFDQLDGDRVSGAIARYLEPTSWTIALGSVGLPAWMPHPGKVRMRRAAAEARQLVGEFVARRRGARQYPPDLAQVLMDARDPKTEQGLSDEHLVSMFLTLIAAGHETTANAMTWALYCLATQPERQDALADHVCTVVGGSHVEASDLEALPEVTGFIDETMRLLPPVPMMSRRASRPCELAEQRIGSDAIVFIPIYAIHRHRALWPSPDVFDPVRFEGEARAAMPRCAYMPFGAGPRICLGASFAMMEMVAGFATLLRTLRFRLHGDAPPEPVHRVTLRPRREMVLTIEARR